MDWIQQWQSKLNKQNGVAPLVRTGGSRHTGLAALPYRNIHLYGKHPGKEDRRKDSRYPCGIQLPLGGGCENHNSRKEYRTEACTADTGLVQQI